MLYFIQSNRQERLFERLCQSLHDSVADPLQAQEIVVQNQGMARWLSQQIALKKGIAAHLHFPLPARFIWQIFSSQLVVKGDERMFDRSVMRWRILDEFSNLAGQEFFQDVAAYLDDDKDGRKAFHLSGKIADLFDQYLVYRPDMLLSWESETAHGWQSELWKRLAASTDPHRARYLQQFREKSLQGELDPSTLPQRVFLFGISSLAPVYLEMIYAISSVVDVYLYHLSPCRDYWADVVSNAEIARKRSGANGRINEAGCDYYETGNPLLASLGKMGREFVSLVYDMEMVEEEVYESTAQNSMLSLVQRDILNLEDHSVSTAEKLDVQEGDRSIQLHSCHSRIREIQILHDRLLEMFEADPDLKPGDVLVMAPSIEEYSSAVNAVFDGAAGSMFLPWSLADRSFRGQEPLIDSFLALFELCGGRGSGPEVLSFLETGAVMRRFQLDAEGLATIRNWVHESGIRWGFTQTHRQEFEPAMDDTHSWSFGMDRLFMGYYMGEESDLVQGISPCGILSADKGMLLGRLAAFLDHLQKARAQMTLEKSSVEWEGLLLQLLDDFYAPGTNEQDQQTILLLRESICSLGGNCRQAGFTRQVSLSVIKAWLAEDLSQQSSGQAFLSGRVTFCNMVPMRSVPFKVICLLGMNDTDYPRNQSAVGFDMIAQDPRTGDRNRRDDDRYLFLEALISARDVFYISWIGNDQRDNSIRPPSVMVADLLDYLTRSFVSVSGGGIEWLVTEHPLQPFSTRCFDGSQGTASYADHWLPATIKQKHAFIEHPLPEPSAEMREVELAQLVRFWSHPVRYFLRQRLEMQIMDDDEQLEENEPFQLGHLARYSLTDRLIQGRLAGQKADEQYSYFTAEGLLPHGNFGRNLFQELHTNADSFASGLIELIQNPIDPQEIDIIVDSFRLTGWVRDLFDTGCIRYRPARLKGRDLVRLWIEHLVLNAVNTATSQLKSMFIARDATVTLRPVAEPLVELQTLLDLYWKGLSTPLHFYPETSRSWFEAEENDKAKKANEAWSGGFFKRGESEGFEYRIALQGKEPLGEEFTNVATAILAPLYKHLENGDAAL